MKTRTVRTAAALLVLVLAGAVTGVPARAQAPVQAVVAISNLPPRLLGVSLAVAAQIGQLINDSLTVVDSQGKVGGRLAAQYPVSPDGKTYLVALRDAKFQDGTPVTAQDVKFTYELYLHPKYPTTPPALLEIAGAQEYKAAKAPHVTGITVVNPKTVRFILNRPYPFFYEQIGTVAILPAHALAGLDVERLQESPFMRRPVGAGPYRLTEWRERENITLEAFRDYWGGAPTLPRIVLKAIPDDATVAAELRAGNIDAGRIIAESYRAFQRDPQITVLRVPGDTYYWFTPSFRQAIFQDVRVRQAMAYAINRPEMLRALYQGLGAIAQSPVHPSLWQYDKNVRGDAYDPVKAKQLLAEAGWTPGPDGILQKSGQRFAVKYGFLAGRDYQNQALLIQQYLRAVGIDVQVQSVEFGDFFSRYYTPGGNFDLAGLAWFNLLIPVQAELDNNFRSSGIGARTIGYSNPEMDKLLDEAILTRDRTRQQTVYAEIQRLVIQDAPRVMTVRPDVLWGIRKRFVVPGDINSLSAFFKSLPRWKQR